MMLVHQASPIRNRVCLLPAKRIEIIRSVKFKLFSFSATFYYVFFLNIHLLVLHTTIAVKELNKEGWKDIHHAAYEGNLAKYTLIQIIKLFLTNSASVLIRAQKQLLASRFSAFDVMNLLSKRHASQMQSHALI